MKKRILTLLVWLSVFLLFASIVNAYWDTVADIRGELVSGVFLLLAAGFAYEWGLKQYFRQREHELILKRYLTEGIDLISMHVTNAEQAFIYNHNKASEVLDQLKVFKKGDLSVKFLTVQTYLGSMPIQKLRYLLGDDILATSIQELLIFINSKGTYLNTFFYPQALKIEQALKNHKNPETLEQLEGELTDALKRHLDEDFSVFTQYAFVQTELQRIASILEKETTLTWSDLNEFQKRSEIKEDVKMVKKMLDIVQEARRSILEQKPK
jgi:hypothetical protein